MAINANLLQRPSDRTLFLTAAIGFPLLVLVGYFRSYYFSAFFDVKPVANSLVHLHGIVMTLWVAYFTAQIALVRTKNIKLHMTLGIAGIGLAALLIVVGMVTAYDAHIIRRSSPPGIDPHAFFIVPFLDMLLFAVFFGGAIFYRKRPAEHKSLMLMTAINFLPAAFGRMPFIPPQLMILWAFGMPSLIALICLGWQTWKYRKLNVVFLIAVVLLIASYPFRVVFSTSQIWLDFVTSIAP